MNEQELISKWLNLAGVDEPKTKQFPESDKFQLALSLILEELLEAAESGSNEDFYKFLNKVQKEVDSARNKLSSRSFRAEGDFTELRDACADMRVVMGNLIHFSGLKKQFTEDFNEVMKSNFSKFCESETEADETIKVYADGTHPNKIGEKVDCYKEQVGEYWIIKRKDNNKVLKSKNFREPEFNK